MATAPDRVDPVFPDALAGDGGMTDPVTTGRRRDASYDVFPDALSALPLPALTLVVPPAVGVGVPVGVPAPGFAAVSRTTPAPPPAPRRAPAARPAAPPAGPAWAGFPPPGQPAAFSPPAMVAAPYAGPPAPARQNRPALTADTARGVLAPGSGSRPVAGFGYVPPSTGTPGVVRPPAYLPQNPGLAQVRAAFQQARASGLRPPTNRPASAPGTRPTTGRPTPPAARRSSRASSVWSLVVFAIILLVSTGLGQKIVEALSDLWSHR